MKKELKKQDKIMSVTTVGQKSCVISVPMEDSVEKVAEAMTVKFLSSVPVVNPEGEIFGVISLIDLERFRLTKQNPRSVRAWEICSFKPVLAEPGAELLEVAKRMLEHNVHHCVITENGSIMGIVSSMDFLREYVSIAKSV